MPRINHTPPANPAILQAFNMATDVVPSPTQFSPRVGFNWDPRGKAKEQLRGGVGIFSGRTPYVWIANQFANDGVSFGSVAIASNNANKIPYVTDPERAADEPHGRRRGSGRDEGGREPGGPELPVPHAAAGQPRVRLEPAAAA